MGIILAAPVITATTGSPSVFFADDHAPILFEALPTDRRASEEELQAHIQSLAPLAHTSIDAINIPEIVSGEYHTVEPRFFGRNITEAHGLKTIVNKITVLDPPKTLDAWIDETTNHFGIHDFVLVGGESSKEDYPGPDVPTALRDHFTPRLQRATNEAATSNSNGEPHTDGNAENTQLGIITIPTRRRSDLDEPQRLLQKQHAGATFAVSQILCESDSAIRLQEDNLAASARAGVEPIPVFWSLAPVVRSRDITFLEWLGVQIPRDLKAMLRHADGPETRLRVSNTLNEAIARNLLEHAEESDVAPVGFCVEHVTKNNLQSALELVQSIKEFCGEFRPRPVTAPAA